MTYSLIFAVCSCIGFTACTWHINKLNAAYAEGIKSGADLGEDLMGTKGIAPLTSSF